MMPGDYPLSLYQGDYWTKTFVLGEQTDPEDPATFVAADLTGCTATAIIKTARKKTEVMASMVCTVLDPPTEGRVVVELGVDEAVKLVKNGVWDLRVTNAQGHRQTWLTGDVTVELDV